VPRLTTEEAEKIAGEGAWFNHAIAGAYPPGSTFKILTSIAAMRSGRLQPDQPIADCGGCGHGRQQALLLRNGEAHHGELKLPEAIAKSCDIYFYEAGRLATVEGLAAEAKRFHLDQRTGIEFAR